jgi:hypothetical protein
MRDLIRRIENLERSLIGAEIHLVMADGSVTTIQERWIPRIFREAMRIGIMIYWSAADPSPNLYSGRLVGL